MPFTRINLNLLICLHHILKEQSVSLAAKKMFVSQSAMSKSLAQLREHLNDPIIIRNKGRTEITAAAKNMQRQVEHIVFSAMQFFENTTFKPETSQKKFSILCGEIALQQFFPSLVQKLSTYAPSVSIELSHFSSDHLKKILNGEVDLALMFSQETHNHLHYKTLMTDELVVMMSKDHPLADATFDHENFTEYPFVTLTPEHKEYSLTSQKLSTEFQRKIVAQVPCVSMIFNLLQENPYMAVLPKTAISLAKDRFDFIQKPLPIKENTKIPLNLIWSPGHDNISSVKWLRSWIIKHFNECLKV